MASSILLWSIFFDIMVRFFNETLGCEFLPGISTRVYKWLIVTCRQLKADLFTILDRFVEQAAMLDSL